MPDPWVDLEPFWNAAQMRDESLLLTDNGDRVPRAQLLTKGWLVSLTDAGEAKTYQVDTDFFFDDQTKTITLPSHSAVPQATLADLTTLRAAAAEGHQFHDRQVAATYTRMESLNPALVAMSGGENLAHLRGKLLLGKSVRVVIYGDSIAEGFNSSGLMGAPPYRPPWAVQLARRLTAQYGSSVTLLNPSVVGTSSQWGKDNLAALVTDLQPDLVVVAFGMNDAAGAMPVSEYRSNIEAIVDGIRASTSADVVLVASMLPDPSSDRACLVVRRPYRDALHQAANRQGQATGWVDMLQVHQTLLGLAAPVASCEADATCSCSSSTLAAQSQTGPKTFQDLTGNGINHPNDWLGRWYAVEVSELLAP